MKIGIIGGTGLYELPGLESRGFLKMETPFGAPSDEYFHGTLSDREVYFLPRHGRGHRILPMEINHRANIFGFKKLGVERIISVSAVGSLKEEYRPRDIVLPDQYFDRTKNSAGHTFFGRGIVAHVGFADPVCPELRGFLDGVSRKVVKAGKEHSHCRVHNSGTYVNMEGPAFSTRAESFYYRKMGFDVIGMTSLAEAKLCREAEICYSPLAMVTDYDCWRVVGETVTVEMIIHILASNVKLAQEIVASAVNNLPEKRTCSCRRALHNTIMTRPDLIPADLKQALAPIIGKYIQ